MAALTKEVAPLTGWPESDILPIVKKRRKVLFYSLLPTLLLSAYPVFILGYTWFNVAHCDLPGGRNGPLDAYRHTLASASVSYTIGPWAVDLVTNIMEYSGKRSTIMDRHNNRIGAEIGTRATSFAELEPLVRQQVLAGGVDVTESRRTTWLPKEDWEESWLW